ncbi:MAG: YbgA family protein [Anaerolineae bacterium]
MNEAVFSRPRLVVSKCLGFDHCRYDGSIIPDPVVDSLRLWVEFIPVCPEMEIGLGAPRPPVRLVRIGGEVRLLQPATGRDLTDAMQAFATSFLDSLPPVDGFVLKNRSPSCGLKDAKVYAAPEKAPALGAGPGMFGGAVQARCPDLPAEDEGRLTNRAIREHFYTAIFALARLREAVGAGQMGALVDFHTRHKFLLMAYSQARLQELGRVVANLQRRPTGEVMKAYVAGFRAALARPPRRPSVVNVLMHALGYVSDGLSPAEKGYFLDLLTAYREGRVPLSAPLSVLRAWVLRFGEPYLSGQAFLSPFPEALLSLRDSGRGDS